VGVLLTIIQEEAVSENLKNMLLVLSNGGYLAPPEQQPERQEMWRETWKRINRVMPELYGEVFPGEVGSEREVEVAGREKGKGNDEGKDGSEKVGEEGVDEEGER
jgi:brefeldin A-resistance guanine nucleotide exchange factor 1